MLINVHNSSHIHTREHAHLFKSMPSKQPSAYSENDTMKHNFQRAIFSLSGNYFAFILLLNFVVIISLKYFTGV